MRTSVWMASGSLAEAQNVRLAGESPSFRETSTPDATPEENQQKTCSSHR